MFASSVALRGGGFSAKVGAAAPMMAAADRLGSSGPAEIQAELSSFFAAHARNIARIIARGFCSSVYKCHSSSVFFTSLCGYSFWMIVNNRYGCMRWCVLSVLFYFLNFTVFVFLP